MVLNIYIGEDDKYYIDIITRKPSKHKKIGALEPLEVLAKSIIYTTKLIKNRSFMYAIYKRGMCGR